MKKWETIAKLKTENSKLKTGDIIKVLLQNRGIKTRKQIEGFLNPRLESISSENLGIDKKELKKAVKRIKKAIDLEEKIVVFGDYDADGVCATAILWEALNSLGADVWPYIPHRIDEGYGLSIKGIENCKLQAANCKLIMTVDNGIVANEAVDYANKKNIDIIITDHHVPSKKLPKACAIVHTTEVCGAGVAYLLSQKIKDPRPRSAKRGGQRSKIKNNDKEEHLELVAIATVADLVPLKGANRTLVKFGLEKIKKTKRPGLRAIFKEAQLDPEDIGVYELGHIIAPRINAMGRLEYAMDSLRLLCTRDDVRAKALAEKIGKINKERQSLTEETVLHAKSVIQNSMHFTGQKMLFISHESYQPGVIGLVAGKLVDEYYRPAIVISRGEAYSKASARSVKGFDMIEFIRKHSKLLVDAGGHPMAAGFTVETSKISILKEAFEKLAEKMLDEEKLTRKLYADLEIDLFLVSQDLFDQIQKLSPFGMGNPEPVFVSKNVIIEDMRLVGNDGKHLKLKFILHNSKFKILDGIAFGMGEKAKGLHIGDKIDIVYTINSDSWNGNKRLQLKIKDFRTF